MFTLEEAFNQIEERAQKQIQRSKEQAEKTFRAVEKLRAAGIECRDVSYYNMDWYTIELSPEDTAQSFFSNTKKRQGELIRKLNEIRKALGCRFSTPCKDVVNAQKRIIGITLQAEDFPTVRIRYQKRLKQGAKCKIQSTTHRSTSLVCSIK